MKEFDAIRAFEEKTIRCAASIGVMGLFGIEMIKEFETVNPGISVDLFISKTVLWPGLWQTKPTANSYPKPSAMPARRTINATIHATPHCMAATIRALFMPSSFFTAAIAATHGV